MVNLYKRQGVQLHNPAPIQTEQSNASLMTKIAQTGLNMYADKLKKSSETNFALGKAKLLNDLTSKAYELAPDNLEQYNKIIEDGLQKQFEGMDKNAQNQIRAALETKNAVIRNKIMQNKLAKQDTQSEELINSNANNLMSAADGFQNTNSLLVDGIFTKNQAQTQEAFENNKRNIQILDNYGKVKSSKGKTFLSENDVNKMKKNVHDDLVSQFKGRLAELDKAGIQDLYKTTLSDVKGMQKLGFTLEDIDNFKSLATKYGKEYDKNIELTRTAQNSLNAAKQVLNFNPDEAKQLKKEGFITGDLYDEMKTAHEIKINPALVDNEDLNLVQQFAQLKDLAEDDGKSREATLAKLANTQKVLNEFYQNKGTTEDNLKVQRNNMYNLLTNQDIANMMKPLFASGTLSGELLNQAYGESIKRIEKYEKDKRFTKAQVDYQRGILEKSMKGYKEDFINDLTKNDAFVEVASKGLMDLSAIASNLQNPNITNEAKEQIKQDFENYKISFNKELAKAKYYGAGIFEKSQLDEAERLYNQGKEGKLVHNGIVYLFKGYSSNDIIVSTKE